jgi:hypothetical protein
MTRSGSSLGAKELDAEALARAVKDALAGQPKALDDLLTRYGNSPGRANDKLGLAFGVEINAQPGNITSLLARLTNDDADHDTQRVFLPIAAAYGWCAYLTSAKPRKNSEIETAWVALLQLMVDGRLPVRLGSVDALIALCAHPGQADALIQRGTSWLEFEEDREARFGSSAAVLAVLGNAQVLASIREHEAMLAYISSAIEAIGSAPRSAERSEARRRALRMLPDALCTVMARMARVAGERAVAWLTTECERAEQREVREALSDAIVRMQRDPQGVGRATVERLRKTLEASAAPLRDGVVKRPGTGRGKSTRKIR